MLRDMAHHVQACHNSVLKLQRLRDTQAELEEEHPSKATLTSISADQHTNVPVLAVFETRPVVVSTICSICDPQDQSNLKHHWLWVHQNEGVRPHPPTHTQTLLTHTLTLTHTHIHTPTHPHTHTHAHTNTSPYRN